MIIRYVLSVCLFALFLPSLASGQKLDQATLATLEAEETALYQTLQQLLTAPAADMSTLDADFVAAWDRVKQLDTKALEKANAFLFRNIRLGNVRRDAGQGAIFHIYSQLPPDLELPADLFEFALLSSELRDDNSQAVDFTGSTMSVTANERAGKGPRVTVACPIEGDKEVAGRLKGPIEMMARFVTDYERLELQQGLAGQSFEFNRQTVSLLGLGNHYAVLAGEALKASELQHVNLNAEGVALVPNPQKANQLPENGLMWLDRQAIELFLNKPKISEKEFKKAIHPHMIALHNNSISKEEALLIVHPTALDNLIIYRPIYGVEQTVSIAIE